MLCPTRCIPQEMLTDGTETIPRTHAHSPNWFARSLSSDAVHRAERANPVAEQGSLTRQTTFSFIEETNSQSALPNRNSFGNHTFCYSIFNEQSLNLAFLHPARRDRIVFPYKHTKTETFCSRKHDIIIVFPASPRQSVTRQVWITYYKD